MSDEDVLYQVFDANLIMAGLLPVRVKIANSGRDAVSIRKARFTITSSGGTSYKSVSGAAAFKTLMKYYEIQNYQKFGYKQSRGDFVSYSLDVESPLAAGEQRSGFLFFAVQPDRAREPGLSLVVTTLNPGNSKSAEINLGLN